MKKISIVFVCLTLMFSTIGFTTAVNNETIYVDAGGGADFTRIQDAIDNASDGDTVFVYSGLYYEQLVIKSKSITLQGEHMETTIIDAGGDGTALYISETTDVFVSGFTFQHSGIGWIEAGVFLFRSSTCTIKENIVRNCGFGIVVYGSSHSSVSWNHMMSNNVGIMLTGTENVKIMRNNIENSSHRGIYLNGCRFDSITENNFINNKGHLWFYGVYFVVINANYWERIINVNFKPITGLFSFIIIPIPGLIFDWNPANEPYEIDGGIL